MCHLNCDCKPLDSDFGLQLLSLSPRAIDKPVLSAKLTDFYKLSVVSWFFGDAESVSNTYFLIEVPEGQNPEIPLVIARLLHKFTNIFGAHG